MRPAIFCKFPKEMIVHMEVSVFIDSHEVPAGSVTREGDVPFTWHGDVYKFISDSATVNQEEVLTHLWQEIRLKHPEIWAAKRLSDHG